MTAENDGKLETCPTRGAARYKPAPYSRNDTPAVTMNTAIVSVRKRGDLHGQEEGDAGRGSIPPLRLGILSFEGQTAMSKSLQDFLPPALSQIRRESAPVINPNAAHEEHLTALEKLAIGINDHVGTPGFFFIIITWTIVWLGWNLLAPKSLKFDPPTSFVLWLFLSNCLQIFLMPLIMVAENMQDRRTQLRAESDYLVNVKAEREIEFLFRHLEYQNAVLTTLVRKLDIDVNEIADELRKQAQDDAKDDVGEMPVK